MVPAELLSTLLDLSLTQYLSFGGIALLFYCVINRETRNVPPGPNGLPILGYIPFLKDLTAHKQLWKLSHKYGSIFSIKLGPNNCIIVNDHKSAIELLGLKATHARPECNVFSLTFGSDDHLLSWRGAVFKEHRKFSQKALRAVGVGKPEMERLIASEISYMLDQIEKDSQDGTCAVNVDKYLTASTSNVVNAVVTGKRFDYDHPFRVKQDAVFSNSPENLEFTVFWTGYISNLVPLFKLLKYIPLKLNRALQEVNDVLKQSLIDEREAQLKLDNIAPDANIIAAYIAETKLKNSNSDRIPGLGGVLLAAGSGTVRDVLEWALLNCAYYPNIQDRLVSELEQIIGFDRKPRYDDRNRMPYTQAFICETMRQASTMPLNLPHVALSDIQINGYTIPRGYHIFVNFWAIYHDPNYWPKPEEFKVERFLTPEGDKVVKHEALMPFSTGRRSCPGEPLAQVQLFMYLTTTLQRFKLQPPVGVNLTLECLASGFSLIPKHSHLKFTNRR